MNLLINTASAFKGGSVQGSKSFLDECGKYPQNTYHVVLGPSLSGIVQKSSFPANFKFYDIGCRPATRVFSCKSASPFFRNLEAHQDIDVVFTTSGPAYWRPNAPHLVGFNLAHCIYPESSFFSFLPSTKQLKWHLKREVIRHFFRREADAYVVQTDVVNLRVRRFLSSEKVHTVSNTCAAHYFNPPVFPDKLPPGKAGDFRLLTLSAWYLHKNLAIIPEVIAALPPEERDRLRFVLTLPPEDYAQHFAERYRPWVVNVGPVPVEQGPALYRECDAMFLPTLLECFSASYPEAMAMQRPILTSDLDFARSICMDAALYFDPLNPADIARQICALMGSAELRAGLTTRGEERLKAFGTAHSRAGQYLSLCEQLVSMKARKK
jgi:glycosyltransferase involved in cell wall biosynthesis